jgi:hypothetical protein
VPYGGRADAVRTLTARIIFAATAVCALVVVAIYSGALTFIASDRDVSTRALWSIATYWALFVLLVLLVAGVAGRPREMSLALLATVVFLGAAEVSVRVLDVDRARTPYSGLSSSRFHHVNAPDLDMSTATRWSFATTRTACAATSRARSSWRIPTAYSYWETPSCGGWVCARRKWSPR